MNLNRTTDSAGSYRELVVVKAYKAELRDRCRHRVEAIEPAGIGSELRPLCLEHLPDRLLGQLRMGMHLGVGDAFIEQPRVQFVKILEPQTRREEPLTDQPDLVLDLPLLPARCRRAGDRVDEVMAAHLQEAAIVQETLADEDRLHRRLHVVVDAALACSLEQGKSPIVRVEHHPLRLAGIGAHEQHAAVTEPDVGSLHDYRHAAQQDALVAPVELVGFARSKAQRDICCSRRCSALVAPTVAETPDSIVSTVVAKPSQLLEQSDQRQTFARRLAFVRQQQLIEFVPPRANLWKRLRLSLVAELGRFRSDDLPYDLP